MSSSNLHNRIVSHLSQLRSRSAIDYLPEVQSLITQEAANIAAEMFAHATPRIPGGVFFLKELTTNLQKLGFSLEQIFIAIDHLKKFINDQA